MIGHNTVHVSILLERAPLAKRPWCSYCPLPGFDCDCDKHKINIYTVRVIVTSYKYKDIRGNWNMYSQLEGFPGTVHLNYK